jgi:hypothetical protein
MNNLTAAIFADEVSSPLSSEEERALESGSCVIEMGFDATTRAVIGVTGNNSAALLPCNNISTWATVAGEIS